MTRLGDVADLTVGFVGSMTPYYRDKGVIFLRSQNVRPFWIDDRDAVKVTPEFEKSIAKSRLREGDVVVVRTGAPGVAAVVPSHLEGSNCADLVVVRSHADIDPRWLCAFFNSIAQAQISAHTVGAVQQHFNVGAAKALVLPSTSYAQQRGIGEVLGALDDKIAANRRIIDRTSELVDAMYSAARKHDGGHIFDDVARIGGGGTPSTKEPAFWDGDVCWLTPTDVTSSGAAWIEATTRQISEEGLSACASPRYPAGSLMMTSRATIGSLVVNGCPMAVNQGFIVLQPNEEAMRWWLWAQLRARVPEFVSWANGATFLELSRGTFRRLPVLMPAHGVLDEFDRRATVLMARHRVAAQENVRLAATRDELLPLLMNGTITVRDAESVVREVM